MVSAISNNHAREYFWLHRWQTGSEGTPGWSIYAVSASLHAGRSCSSKFLNALLLSIQCMHASRLSIIHHVNLYFFWSLYTLQKLLSEYVYMVCVFVQHFCKKLVVFEVQKIVAVYSGIKHWFFWHIFCISKYNVYFPKISNVPLGVYMYALICL
jgi:hypothetical protein